MASTEVFTREPAVFQPGICVGRRGQFKPGIQYCTEVLLLRNAPGARHLSCGAGNERKGWNTALFGGRVSGRFADLDVQVNAKWGGGIAAVLNGTTPASAFDIWSHVFPAWDLDALARFREVWTESPV